jgi:hypothetical protein
MLMVDGNRRQDWFVAAQKLLDPVLAARNRLMAAYMSNPGCDPTMDAVHKARKAMLWAVETARRDWMECELSVLNANDTASTAGGNPLLTQAVWYAVRALLSEPQEVGVMKPLKLQWPCVGSRKRIIRSRSSI